MKRFVLFLALGFVFFGCSSDDSPGNCNYERELNEFNQRFDVWVDNVTPANCNDLRSSAIRLLQKMEGCPGVTNLEATMKEWRDIDCDI